MKAFRIWLSAYILVSLLALAIMSVKDPSSLATTTPSRTDIELPVPSVAHGLEDHLIEITGIDAIDCGKFNKLDFADNAIRVYLCIHNAMMQPEPFRFTYRDGVLDLSTVMGLASEKGGRVMFFLYNPTIDVFIDIPCENPQLRPESPLPIACGGPENSIQERGRRTIEARLPPKENPIAPAGFPIYCLLIRSR